jgi:glycosyltransferase involved in cell wall biosynthesis
VRVLYHHRIRAIDGQAVHVRALQEALLAEGHEVCEVALVPLLGSKAGTTATPAMPAPDPATRARSLNWIPRLPRPLLELAEYAYSIVAPGMIARAAARDRPDFIYERYAFGNLGGVVAGRRLAVPVVLEVNSPLVDELAATRGLFFPRLARRLEGFVVRRADLVCTVSEVLRDMVIAGGAREDRVVVIPNGVDGEIFRPLDSARRAEIRRRIGLPVNGREQALVLGFSGFVREWHRLDLALACLGRPQLAGARLVVVGDGPQAPWLARRAAELGLADRVLLLGARRHDEMPDLLGAFDVALMPGIPRYASPLKLFEYMAVGLPVVAPNQENLREILQDRENALLFTPGDADALAAVLAELGANEDLRRRLGACARATVLEERRTWRGVARRVVAEATSLLRSWSPSEVPARRSSRA